MANGIAPIEGPRSWVSKRPKIEGWTPPLRDADIESELKRVSRLHAGSELYKEAKLLEELFKPLETPSPKCLRRSPRLATCPPALLQRSESAMRGCLATSPRLLTPLAPPLSRPSTPGRCSVPALFAPGDAKPSPRGSLSEATLGRCAAHTLRSLLVELPILARIVDFVYVLSPALAAVAATSSRWFCACHLAFIATFARRLKCLDRALRFRSHLDFKAADIRVDDVSVNLEVAVDLQELEATQLRSLMGVRSEGSSPPIAAKIAALALHELLIVGRPELTSIFSISGIWPQDRRILDPAILMPLFVRFHRASISRDARRRLRSVFCAQLDQLTPTAVLNSNGCRRSSKTNPAERQDERDSIDSSMNVESWRTAAAAVLQWAWVQLAHDELEGDRTSHLGVLEKSLLLQPSIGVRRIERSRKLVLEKMEVLRSEPLLGRLLHAPLDLQLSTSRPRASPRRSPRASALKPHADKPNQARLMAGKRQKSLPVLQGLQGLHVGSSVPSRAKVEPQSSSTPTRCEPKRYLVGESYAVPSLSILANASNAIPSMNLTGRASLSSGNDCPRTGHNSESRTRNGLVKPSMGFRGKDVDNTSEGQTRGTLAGPRTACVRSEVTLRDALGFPPREEKDSLVALCPTTEPSSPVVIDTYRGARCTPTWQHWRRPGSAPGHLPWSSPGLRFCTPLRA